MSRNNNYSLRSTISGILVGYGFTSLFCFMTLVSWWERTAANHPDDVLGLIYRHNEHGVYTYFSQFQATACGLMFATSIPLAFIGMLIAPRRSGADALGRTISALSWDQNHPSAFVKKVALVTAVITPLFIFLVGPRVIQGLNAAGFVMDIG